ncbi:hypothetical protein [Saccharopolyspora rhizosphaerae]|nr:hypothetical protein [Saccharopolyspora rhizosphaerae]
MSAGRWPMPAVVELGDLGPLSGTVAEQRAGVHRILHHPGWLAKLDEQPAGQDEAVRVDELVALPTALAEDDATVLRTCTAWPAARITTSDGSAHGCVIPAVPEGSRQIGEQHVDRQSRSDRLRACRNLVAVADVLERHDLVHPDWSWNTVLWRPDVSVFVTDVDRCGRGAVPNTPFPDWDDPLTPPAQEADACTARFRVALLVTRWLTGQSEGAAAVGALADSDGLGNRGLREVLLDVLLSTRREQRPSTAELEAVLAGELYVRDGAFPGRLPLPARPVREPSASVEYLD